MCRKQSHLVQKNVNHSFTLFCELAGDIVTSICLNTAPNTYTYSKGKVKKKRECMNHKKECEHVYIKPDEIFRKKMNEEEMAEMSKR